VRGGIAKIIPSVKLTLMLPADVMLKVNMHLFSPALGRVPKGAYQKLLTDLLNDFFKGQTNAPSNPGTDSADQRPAGEDSQQ
jgi:hypothetical protein